MIKFYIAFSIHGTNKFKVATLTTKKKIGVNETQEQFVQRILGKEFSPVASRRPPEAVRADEIKLHWTGLMNKQRLPYSHKGYVNLAFKALAAKGWDVIPSK